MNNLYESYNYDLSFRGIFSNNEFKLYTNNDNINITSEINFDLNADYRSSINYFASAILGGIAHSLISQSKRYNIEIEELEGKINLTLKNPLTLLNVKGYDGEPKIENCRIIYYLYADTTEDILFTFCNTALLHSFIYNTLKNTINFDIKFTLID